MRPLPIQELAGTPAPVLGIALIRGVPTVVLDANRLLGCPPMLPGRFITLRLGARSLALAVDRVIGVRTLPSAQFLALPPLLTATELIDTLGTMDAELLIVLRAGCLVPDDVLRALDAQVTAP